MNHVNAVPPTIAELTAGFLRRTEDAETLAAAADALGDVEPHEVAIGYRAEPRLAWQESMEVLEIERAIKALEDIRQLNLELELQQSHNSKDSHSSKELEVVADPSRYQEVVGEGLATATRMVVARMQAER